MAAIGLGHLFSFTQPFGRRKAIRLVQCACVNVLIHFGGASVCRSSVLIFCSLFASSSVFLFHFIFSFISGTNYFSFLLLLCSTSKYTHISSIRVLFYCVDSSIFLSRLSYFFWHNSAHTALMDILHRTIFYIHEHDVDDGCFLPRLKCTHLFVIITVIKE